MLLAVDIGNTNIVLGCFMGSELVYECRLRTDAGRTVDEYRAILMLLLDQGLKGKPAVRQAIISSVVPPVTPRMLNLVYELFGVRALEVEPGVKTGLSIAVAEPTAVGADRVVNSVAAKCLHGLPVLVVDFGTATTIDYVDAHSSYQGGVIAPGLESALNALVRDTAKLPRIELEWPERVIGKTTVTAMQSGAVVGYTSLVDGLICRMREEAGVEAQVIATGGLGRLISSHSRYITHFDPCLTLQGLRILSELNQ